MLALICVIAGVALGFFLPALGNFAATFPIPFGEPIEKLSCFDQPLVVMLRPLIGAILGMVAATAMYASSPKLHIDEEKIIVDQRNGHPLTMSREAFGSAYFDDGKLTIVTAGGHQAFKGNIEDKKDAIAEAFSSRGYRWGMI